MRGPGCLYGQKAGSRVCSAPLNRAAPRPGHEIARTGSGATLRRCAWAALAFSLVAFAWSAPLRAEDKPRIASINVCTDQLLLAIADPQQIVGLSPYSRDPARSWAAAQAARYRRLSGEAEDVLILHPDVIVSSAFTRRATRDMLKAKGFRVVEFAIAQSLDEAREQIVQMGELVGQAERAAQVAARLDAAIARAKAAASRRHFSVLPLSRRGWVSGADTLISSLLDATGLSNAAHAAGLRSGGFASLEQIVSFRPDFILVDDGSAFAEDQGRAFLLHPALETLYPPARRILVPERLTVCGGPMLAEALDLLTTEIERVVR
jgi:iron complex transport system substrate-binding protein